MVEKYEIFPTYIWKFKVPNYETLNFQIEVGNISYFLFI